MIKWTHCISQVDGITRYLKYMNKKMMRYQRLITNVTDVKELKEIVENIKDWAIGELYRACNTHDTRL